MGAFQFNLVADPLLATAIVIAIYAVGDFISVKTKGLISVLLTGSVLFLLGFWSGVLPTNIDATSNLAVINTFGVALLITHMGTLLNVRELAKQWKTVLIALAAIAGIGLFLLTAGSLLFGRVYAYSAAAPIAGGLVAMIITAAAATAANEPLIAVFVALVGAFQGFIGMPGASYCLRREAQRYISSGRYKIDAANAASEVAAASETTKKPFSIRIFPPMPEAYQTTYVLLAKLAIIGWIGYNVGVATMIPGSSPVNYYLHPYVTCLLVGIVASEIGLLEQNILTKANSFGFLMVALMAIIPGSLGKATPGDVAGMLLPLFGLLVFGGLGICLGSIPVGKLLGFSWEMSAAIGFTAMFGFPGTYVLSNEAAKNNGATEEERKAILDHILPKMLVAGFITVTIVSVIFAGVLAPMIFR
jgi:hypothetical protein